MSQQPLSIEEELQIDTHAFEALEKDFQDVLQELAGDASLERFRLEYEKLHRALKASHENEKKLLRRCKELNGDIVGHAAKVQAALKLTQEDTQTITILKEEINKAYKMIEQAREREEKNKGKIENLHAEIKHLRGLIDQGNSISSGQNNTVNELIASNESLKRQVELGSKNLESVKNDLTNALDKIRTQDSEIKDYVENIHVLKSRINDMEEKKLKEDSRLKNLHAEMDNIKKNYTQATSEKERTEVEIRKLISEKDELIEAKRELEKQKDQQKREIENLEDRNEDQSKKLKEKQEMIEDMIRKSHETDVQMNYLRGNFNKARTDADSRLTEVNKLRKEVDMVKNQKKQVERERDSALSTVDALERVINDTRKMATDDRKSIEQMKASRDLLNKELNRAESNNKRQKEDLNKYEKANVEKDNEIITLMKEIEAKNKKIASLEKEKEKYGINAAQANAKYFHALEEIKLKDNLISEFQKKNIETEAKLKQQQNLYEAVRSDRNLYSKNLTETQDEIAEIKRRYKIVSHEISQLKEEIDAKEAALTKEHFDLKQAEKKAEELQKQTVKYAQEHKKKEEKIKSLLNEISKLQFIINESEKQRKKLKEEYESVISERDILGTQLIRKNDELALLYEKIKIQQSTLAKGEAQYRERLNDIDHLRHKIKEQYHTLKIARKQADMIPELKNEVHNLQKELIEEKLKVRGLSDELENPMNVHRWRKLEGTDSDTYEMITKIQTLQKRLIAKTEECVEKDVVIEQKEKALNELREMMKRQPSIEDAKMISDYQQMIKQKTRQMKAMAAELNMYQHQTNEYKSEVDRLTRDVQESKRKYFEIKKREQMAREQIDKAQKAMQMQINLPDKRFVGGGFNLAV